MREDLSVLPLRFTRAARGLFAFFVVLSSGGLAVQVCKAQTQIIVSPSSRSSSDVKNATSEKKDASPSSSPRLHTVVVSNNEPFYTPASLTIEAGDAVKWVNSEKSDTHSIHERSAMIMSPDVAAGKDWCFQFPHEGEYSYTCRFHPWMNGKVNVRPRSLEISEIALPVGFSSPSLATGHATSSPWLLAGGLRPMMGQLTSGGRVISHPMRFRLQAGNGFCLTGDGHIWFINRTAGTLIEYDPSALVTRVHATRQRVAKLSAVAAASDGTIWVFDAASRSFASFDPWTGKLANRKPQKLASNPIEMASGRDGKLWFIEEARNCVAAYDPRTDEVKEYPLPERANLTALLVTESGPVWAADAGRNKIITVDKGWIAEFTVPTTFSLPQGIAADTLGSVWFTETLGNKIGRVHDGRIDEYVIPTPDSRPAGMAMDGDGNLWFAEQGKLGRISAATIRSISEADRKLDQVVCPAVVAEPTRPKPDSNPNHRSQGGNNVSSHR